MRQILRVTSCALNTQMDPVQIDFNCSSKTGARPGTGEGVAHLSAPESELKALNIDKNDICSAIEAGLRARDRVDLNCPTGGQLIPWWNTDGKKALCRNHLILTAEAAARLCSPPPEAAPGPNPVKPVRQKKTPLIM